ncbi:MAG: pilus assembly protein PilM [Candidatus Kerfeldbacteria bacterium]|nr:pilus assembly protein PilM [Candidatus Kerfeldbacteria bacterium]
MARFSFSQRTFGIDLSDHSIELMEIGSRFGRPLIRTAGRVELESGTVVNGRVDMKDKFVSAVHRLLMSANVDHHGGHRAIIAIPETQLYLYVFTVPGAVPEDRIGESVQFMAEETLPLAFDQVYHDYQILSRGPEGIDVVYVACARDIVDTLRTSLLAAGITPIVIEPESAALARAIIPAGPVPPTLILDIGSRASTITIFDRHGIRYSYTVPVAGHAFTQALMRGRNISTEEAVRLKRERLVNIQTAAELAEPLHQIIERISTSILYYEHKTGFAVSQAILVGGSSLLPGLDRYVHDQLRLPVIIGNPLHGLNYNRAQFPDDNRRVLYATVAGLALRGATHTRLHQGLNLLRHEETHRRLAVGHWFHRGTATHLPVATPAPQRAMHAGPPSTSKRTKLLLMIFFGLIIVFLIVLMIRPNG